MACVHRKAIYVSFAVQYAEQYSGRFQKKLKPIVHCNGIFAQRNYEDAPHDEVSVGEG